MKSKNVQSSESVQLYTESFGQSSKMAYVLTAGVISSGSIGATQDQLI